MCLVVDKVAHHESNAIFRRQEWEEKLSRAEEQTDLYKRKYLDQKTAPSSSHGDSGSQLMEDARSMSQKMFSPGENSNRNTSFHSGSVPRGAQSVASLGSSMAQHAKSLVGNFACAGLNERTDPLDTSIPGKMGPAQQWRERQQQKRQAANGGLESPPAYTASSTFQATPTGGPPRHDDL